MPTAPTCRLCGSVHWSYEPHQFGDKPVTRNAVVTKRDPVTKPVTIPDRESTIAVAEALQRQVTDLQEQLRLASVALVEMTQLKLKAEADLAMHLQVEHKDITGPPKRDRAAYMRKYRAKS